MTVLTILASIAAIIVCVIAVSNTEGAGRGRRTIRSRFARWRERRRLQQEIQRFRAEPALAEVERRFDDLLEACETKHVPPDLAALWAALFALARTSPVGTPFRYGSLELHQNQGAMTIRRGADSITGSDRLDPMRIPPPPRTAVNQGAPPIAVIKE